MNQDLMSEELAFRIETIAARAWPPLARQPLNGWTLRYSHGVTRRANSVLPLGWGEDGDVLQSLARAEAYYREHGVAPRFQISPAARPVGLDQLLTDRGYRLTARTAVQTASLASVAARLAPSGQWRVRIVESPDPAWLAVYADAEAASEPSLRVRQAIMAAIPDRGGYALVMDDAGHAAAVASAVVADGYLGIFNVATVPSYRRRGAALAVMHGLVTWGAAHGADDVYLQVMADNSPALALYERLGLLTRYHYHYRELS